MTAPFRAATLHRTTHAHQSLIINSIFISHMHQRCQACAIPPRGRGLRLTLRQSDRKACASGLDILNLDAAVMGQYDLLDKR